MSYGLRVESSSGHMQIDENWSHFGYRGGGTTESTGLKTIDTIPTGVGWYPLVFMRPAMTWAEISAEPSGQVSIGIRYRTDNGRKYATIIDFATESIYWECYEHMYTFDDPTDYGLAVWDSGGSLAYSSDEYTAKIIGYAEDALWPPGQLIWTGTTSDPVPLGFMNGEGWANHISSEPPPDPPDGEDEFSGYMWEVSGSVAKVYTSTVTQTHGNVDSFSLDSEPRLRAVMYGG